VRKLLLLSILFATFAVPMRAARDASAVRGLRRTVVGLALFVAAYVFALVYVFPRLG
jgi:uncharacterized membrane protein (DUF485 family)